ncbi:sulfate transporter-like [Pseudophryne corroboree]|uniref:sulfate transporter-like n=1 Tax=Pseudophryne corroboree TaxID=495146 RepID=UPI0030820EB2
MHVKETDRNTILKHDSFHPQALRNGLTYWQMLRVRRITSDPVETVHAMTEMVNKLAERGYPRIELEKTRDRVLAIPRDEALRTTRETSSESPFVPWVTDTEYSIRNEFPDQSECSLSLPYNSVELEEQIKPAFNIKDIMWEKTKKCCTSSPRKFVRYCFELFPVLTWLPQYKIKEYLLGDIVSGIIVGIVTIPQAIAYSLLASQAPIYGLYTNFFCCIIYFFMASSHHNCVGTFGVLCLMVGESVNKHLKAAGFTEYGDEVLNSTLTSNSTVCGRSCYAIMLATSLTFMVGVYQVLMGIFHLGFISVYLSEPLLSGFVTGSSLTIITSQMKYLLGLKIPRSDGAGSLITTWIDIFTNLQDTNICDFIASAVTIAVMVPVKIINDRFKSKMKVPFPVEIFVIIVATLVSHYYDFNRKYKSSICGSIPTGFMSPRAPEWSMIPSIATDAIPIAIIGFAMTVSLAEIFAKKHGYTVSINQEMIAIGMCNVIPSFFYSFASCAALAKTLLKESTGANTQLNGIVSSLLLMIVLLALSHLLYSLQNSILGVITIVSLKGALVKFADTPKMWRISRIDTVVWWVSMLASALISTEIGLLVGVCFSMLCVIFRTQRPRATLLGNVSGTEIYEDQLQYKELNTIPNIKIYRFNGSLYYANKDYFIASLHSKTGVNPSIVLTLQRKAKREEVTPGQTNHRFGSKLNVIKTVCKPRKSLDTTLSAIDVHSLIIDCGAMQFVDSAGLSILKEVRNDYEEIGVWVFLANCNPSVCRLLHNGDFFSVINSSASEHAFHSVHDAVTFAERKFRKKMTTGINNVSIPTPDHNDTDDGQ